MLDATRATFTTYILVGFAERAGEKFFPENFFRRCAAARRAWVGGGVPGASRGRTRTCAGRTCRRAPCSVRRDSSHRSSLASCSAPPPAQRGGRLVRVRVRAATPRRNPDLARTHCIIARPVAPVSVLRARASAPQLFRRAVWCARAPPHASSVDTRELWALSCFERSAGSAGRGPVHECGVCESFYLFFRLKPFGGTSVARMT